MEPAQKEFDHELSETLDGMTDGLEGNNQPRANYLEVALKDLEVAVTACAAPATPQLSAFLALSRTVAQLALAQA